MRSGTVREWAPNESFWIDALEADRPTPSLSGPLDADVVLIGGGYTSLTTAWFLKTRRPELEVVVLEARYVGFGSSGRNAGMVLAPTHAARAARHDPERVRFTYEQALGAVDLIEGISAAAGFDCDLERTGFLEMALWPGHMRRLAAKQRQCAALGIPLTLLDAEEARAAIDSDRFVGALAHPGALLHPGKYVAGLRRALRERGVRLFERTPALEVRPLEAGHRVGPGSNGHGGGVVGFRVRTPGGEVRAAQCVAGLNAYLPGSGLRLARQRAASIFSFVILTEPLAEGVWREIGWRGRQGYSDARRLHNYVRRVGDRILFGGRVAYRFGLEAPPGRRQAFERLRREMVATFPALEDVELTHRWCGSVAVSWRRAPMIGWRGPGGDSAAVRNGSTGLAATAARAGTLYYAFGYSGHGVSLATLSGRVLADAILGDAGRWSELLYVRDPLRALPPEPLRYLGFEGGYLAKRFLDVLDRLR